MDLQRVKQFNIIGNNPLLNRGIEIAMQVAITELSVLITGESGVGKTAIVDELAYRVKIGEVPSFLQGKIILEVNPSDIVAGCQYVGMFEDNMTKLMKLCEKLDVIVSSIIALVRYRKQ